jgi:hypothetical protein
LTADWIKPFDVIVRFMRATQFVFQMGHPDRAVPRDRVMTIHFCI